MMNRLTMMMALCMGMLCTRGAEPDGIEFFERRVRPILTEHCYECHSTEAEKVKGGLLVDSRAGLLKGGESGPALKPGDPEQSKIIIAVRHADEDLQMPPKRKLTEQQIADLEAWVKMGAPDPREGTANYPKRKDLWSTKPVQPVEPPVVKKKEWVREPVDAFVLARLEKEGLAPVRAASKSELLRRAALDLTGLPPTREEAERFMADASENAYAELIDRLLKSEQFGERWGRHWLDVARYADSNGPDNGQFENAWRYRDYVVAAFNSDKPYDEFIREQIAGDLLEAKDVADKHENWTATGFLVIGPKNFGEPNREKLLMDIADEQIDVTSRAFLGLTVACARCHDHKFDPIPTKDYYAMAGIFRSTRAVTLDQPRPGAAPNFLSERPLGTAEQIAAYEAYQAEVSKITTQIGQSTRMLRETPGGIDSKELDGIVLDNMQGEVIGSWGLSRYSTNFVDKNYLQDGNEKTGKGKKLVRFAPEIPENGFYEIRLAYTPNFNRATNVPVRVSAKDKVRTVYLNQRVAPRYDKAFESLGVFELAAGTNNVVEVLTEGTKGFVIVDAVQFLPKDVVLAAKYMKVKRAAAENEQMMAGPVMSAFEVQELRIRLEDLQSTNRAVLPMALAVQEGETQNVKVHIRGDPENLGEEVPRGFLSAVPIAEPKMPQGKSGRLELAEWIAQPDNPLTARVMVNRVWQQLFGRGLVGTPDNFGAMGEEPVHRELLDYLAREFVEDGWSVKRLVRRLMLSSTYQLSTERNALNESKDVENVLYWRANRRRLDAEALRDSILAISGRLDRQMGGNTLSAAPGPNLPQGRQDVGGSNRRSIYLPVFRGSVNDLYQVFDFPDPSAPAAKRYVTTAPTQALFLMNSPFVLEQARAWAEKLGGETGRNEAELVAEGYWAAFARKPTEGEMGRAVEFLRNYNNALTQVEPDAAARRVKALQGFCQALIESTEFRFLN